MSRPSGKGWDGCEQPCQLQACLERKGVEEVRDILRRGSGLRVCHWFRRRDRLCACACCLLGFYSNLLRGCCSLRFHLFRLRLIFSGSHLGQLGTGPGPLSFQGCRVARGGCPATLRGRLLRKGCFRLFLFHTAPVVRCVVAPTNAAQRLHWVSWAVTRKVRAPTRDAPRSVSAVSLRMAKALAAFALDRAL